MGRYAHVGRFSKESPEDKRIVEHAFEKFNLSSLKDRHFNELSGGEQQKVIIARAIAQQSKILLLDEPTTHLDINYQIDFMEMLREYVNDGLIVIVVLHDLNLASQFCDKIILVNNGEIKALGDVDVILTPENLRDVYNVEVLVRKNLFADSIRLTPLKSIDKAIDGQSDNIKTKSLHVIVGGGAALNILPKLKKYRVSVGVVNETDDDYELAKHFGYKIISEGPFCAISETSAIKLREVLEKVDIIILTNIPFGKGNVKNLELLSQSEKFVINYEKRKIEERDFTEGIATKIYNKLISKPNVVTINDLQELLKLIQNYEEKC